MSALTTFHRRREHQYNCISFVLILWKYSFCWQTTDQKKKTGMKKIYAPREAVHNFILILFGDNMLFCFEATATITAWLSLRHFLHPLNAGDTRQKCQHCVLRCTETKLNQRISRGGYFFCFCSPLGLWSEKEIINKNDSCCYNIDVFARLAWISKPMTSCQAMLI